MKKRILLTLLASLCVGTAAAGLAACSPDDTGNVTPPEETPSTVIDIQTVYEAYASANETPLSYEEWYAFITSNLSSGDSGEQPVEPEPLTITSITHKNGVYTVTLSDGSEIVYKEVRPEYRVTVQDLYGERVEGVKLRLVAFYPSTGVQVNPPTKKPFTPSDEEGIVEFDYDFNFSNNVEYSIQIDDVTGPPAGYDAKEYKVVIKPGVKKYTFEMVDTHYLASYTDNYTFIPYTSVYSMTEEETVNNKTGYVYNTTSNLSEENYGKRQEGATSHLCGEGVTASNWKVEGGVTKADLNISLVKNRHKFFVFAPSVSPSTNGEGPEADERRENALAAASGLYRINISFPESANVRLYEFEKITGQQDEYGLPLDYMVEYISGTAPAGVTGEEAEKYTGVNSITLNLHSKAVSADKYFYLISDEDVEVKLTVERIGEATEYLDKLITVNATETTPCTDVKGEGETLTLMPINGTVEAVLGDDGYYHVATKTGPYLYVTITKTVNRVSDYPLKEFPAHAENGRGVFELGAYVDELNPFLTIRYDYNGLVSDYSALVNADGLYRVNEEIARFLKDYDGGAAAASAKSGYVWLALCQYYEPATGLPLAGEGTGLEPYKLIVGKNTVNTVGELTYTEFVAAEEGYWFIDTTAGLTFRKDQPTVVVDGKTYVFCNMNERILFAVTGSEESYLVRLSHVVTIEATEDADAGNVGTDASCPATLPVGMRQIKLDNNHVTDGLYAVLALPFVGSTVTYTVEVCGEGKIVYDGRTYLSGESLQVVVSSSSERLPLLITVDGLSGLIEPVYVLISTSSQVNT